MWKRHLPYLPNPMKTNRCSFCLIVSCVLALAVAPVAWAGDKPKVTTKTTEEAVTTETVYPDGTTVTEIKYTKGNKADGTEPGDTVKIVTDDKGNPKRRTHRGSDGKLKSVRKWKYDKKGNLTEYTLIWYKKGKKDETHVTTYKDGKKDKTVTTNASGRVIRTHSWFEGEGDPGGFKKKKPKPGDSDFGTFDAFRDFLEPRTGPSTRGLYIGGQNKMPNDAHQQTHDDTGAMRCTDGHITHPSL